MRTTDRDHLIAKVVIGVLGFTLGLVLGLHILARYAP